MGFSCLPVSELAAPLRAQRERRASAKSCSWDPTAAPGLSGLKRAKLYVLLRLAAMPV